MPACLFSRARRYGGRLRAGVTTASAKPLAGAHRVVHGGDRLPHQDTIGVYFIDERAEVPPQFFHVPVRDPHRNGEKRLCPRLK
jgi:hypothetical protein